MRAVIIASLDRPDMYTLTRFTPTFLLKIADKPIIFYILETFAAQGIKKVDVVLRNNPEEIEKTLANGKRWGLCITYHLAKHEEYPFAPIIPAIRKWDDESVVFALGDLLPKLSSNLFREDYSEKSLAITDTSKKALEWCFIHTKVLKNLDKNSSLENFSTQIKENNLSVSVESFLSTQTMQDLINSNSLVIKDFENQYLLPSTAHQVENGIWLSRGISLHPSVKIVTPIFIGEHCRIRAGVNLGPHAIIENHCIIDSGSTIKNSLICQNSYVGENLDIYESIVDRNLLVNLNHKTSIRIREDFILSELNHKPLFDPIMYSIARIMALLLFIVLYPLNVYLRSTCSLKITEVVKLPAFEEPSHWAVFEWKIFTPDPQSQLYTFKNYFKYLPVLFLIFKGFVHFVGVSPRTKEEILKLPPDRQKLYLKSKIGLITLGKLDHGPHISEDEEYASEAYYASQMSLKLDFKLFFRWLKKKLSF